MKQFLVIPFTTIALSLLSVPAIATTWNYPFVGNDSMLYYFDADTVVKSENVTTLWVKSVQTRAPDKQGAWAATSQWRIHCSNRTIRTMAWSEYDKDGNFIRSNNTPSTIDEPATPDSIGEAMLKVACEANFPRDTSGKKYFRIVNNDVFEATRAWLRYKESQVDNAPK